ncbi:MAG: 4Fe-4S dicluster domain-containing protein [Eubacteriales bacterium]
MKEIVEIVKNAGITGAGGAGFPTHVKLSSNADYVIVNGAECEPLLRVDQQLMEMKAEELLFALNLAVESVNAKKGIIALKKKYHKATDKLEILIKNYQNIEIFLLDDFYPAGDEQVTVYEVLGRIVPEGGIPLDVNTVVFNVETLLNIYDAVHGKPVTYKYVTVTGAVNKPMTIKVPIGTPIDYLIQTAGGASIETYSLIDGGPMMGKIIKNNEGFVKKSTKGILVLPTDHPLIIGKNKSIDAMLRESKIACCMCSLCTDACPRYLLGHSIHPDRLMRITGYGSTMDASTSVEEAFLCCECGLCETVCVMGLQPWKLNQLLKGKLAAAGIKNNMNNQPDKVSEFRKYRKFPVKRLIQRFGLTNYDVPAPLDIDKEFEFEKVCINMKQHLGVPAEIIVSTGEEVRAGQMIGKIPEGKLSACIHASISGTVCSTEDGNIIIKKN